MSVIALSINQYKNMAEQQLRQIAAFLLDALQLPIATEQIDIFEPTLLIQSLKILFPDSVSIWTQICQQFDVEQRWNTVIEFIEINLLDGANIEFENLGVEQVLELYMIVAEYVEEKGSEEKGQILQAMNQEGKVKKQKKQGKKDEVKKEKEKIEIEKNRGIQEKQKKYSKDKSKSKGKDKQQSKPKVKQSQPTKPNPQQKKNTNPNPSKPLKPNNKPTQLKSSVVPKPSSIAQKPHSKPKSHSKIQPKPLQEELMDGIKKIISKPIHKPNPKQDVLMRDQKGTEAVARAKRQFDYFLKDFQRQRKMKTKFNPYLKQKLSKNNQVQADEHFLKVLSQKQKNIEEQVTNQQLKYFMTLRDRKIAFINKIHRLTEQLERERQVDWAHQQREMMLKERQKVKLQIQKTQGLFEKNMQMLKNQYKQSKRTQQTQKCDELVLCREMGKAVQKRKIQELDLMRILWQQQNTKLSNIIGDEQKTKNKLIDLYRKNRP